MSEPPSLISVLEIISFFLDLWSETDPVFCCCSCYILFLSVIPFSGRNFAEGLDKESFTLFFVLPTVFWVIWGSYMGYESIVPDWILYSCSALCLVALVAVGWIAIQFHLQMIESEEE